MHSWWGMSSWQNLRHLRVAGATFLNSVAAVASFAVSAFPPLHPLCLSVGPPPNYRSLWPECTIGANLVSLGCLKSLVVPPVCFGQRTCFQDLQALCESPCLPLSLIWGPHAMFCAPADWLISRWQLVWSFCALDLCMPFSFSLKWPPHLYLSSQVPCLFNAHSSCKASGSPTGAAVLTPVCRQAVFPLQKLWSQMAWLWPSALLIADHVTLGTSFSLSVLPFPHLENREIIICTSQHFCEVHIKDQRSQFTWPIKCHKTVCYYCCSMTSLLPHSSYLSGQKSCLISLKLCTGPGL